MFLSTGRAACAVKNNTADLLWPAIKTAGPTRGQRPAGASEHKSTHAHPHIWLLAREHGSGEENQICLNPSGFPRQWIHGANTQKEHKKRKTTQCNGNVDVAHIITDQIRHQFRHLGLSGPIHPYFT